MSVKSTLVATAAISAFSLSAHAASGWYVSGNVASTDIDTISTISAPLAGTPRSIDLSSDSDTGFGLAIGRTVADYANGSLLIELGWNQAESDIEEVVFNTNSFRADQGRSVGDISVQTFSVDAIYQFGKSSLKPYLGFGIGLTDVDIDVRYGGSVNAPAGSPPNINDSDNVLSLQYRAGLEYSVNNSWGVFAEYKFVDVDDISVSRIGGGPGGLATTSQEGDFDIGSFLLGVKYGW